MAGPGEAQPSPPPEPFVHPDRGFLGTNPFWAHTNPIVLFLDGVVVSLGGPAFAWYAYSVTRDKSPFLVAFLVLLALVTLALGAVFFYAAHRRRQWIAAYTRAVGHKPGKTVA